MTYHNILFRFKQVNLFDIYSSDTLWVDSFLNFNAYTYLSFFCRPWQRHYSHVVTDFSTRTSAGRISNGEFRRRESSMWFSGRKRVFIESEKEFVATSSKLVPAVFAAQPTVPNLFQTPLHIHGFLSRIGVVNADFRGEADDLPSKFVVKMVCVLTGLEIAEAAKERHGNDADLKELYEGFDTNIKDLHNREVNVFRIFSRFDYSLSKIPRLYFAQDFTKENELKGDFYGLWI
ncbi:hypothetical protein Y032_0045g1113 [Ancylostoma ceylanicum]|uniref:Uncharacterized protein n=1 Tax=Ancylostoma ceylanicum TaxID=53326 RepID=A0A016UDY5_9BILA|nr:hypothetical protein Y032_0045g1113 [Ancylostoma ceylanicum]